MKMPISAERAAQHLVDEIEASIAAWKRGQGDPGAEIEEAVNLLSGWAHLARLPDSACPSELRADLHALIEADGGRMASLIPGAFDPEGWIEAVRALETVHDSQDEGSLDRLHDAGLALFLQLDEADLAAWAAVQLSEEADPALDGLLGALVGCNAILEDRPRVFAPARGYAQAMLSVYELQGRSSAPDLSKEALQAITSKFEAVAQAAEYGNQEILLDAEAWREMDREVAREEMKIIAFPKRGERPQALRAAADSDRLPAFPRPVVRLRFQATDRSWTASLAIEEPLYPGELAMRVQDGQGNPIERGRVEFCGRDFDLGDGVAKIDDQWLETNWESVVTSDSMILHLESGESQGLRQF